MRQIGAVLGVAVLGTTVRTLEPGGASFTTGLATGFLVAGRRHSLSATFIGLLLNAPVPRQPRMGLPNRWMSSRRLHLISR